MRFHNWQPNSLELARLMKQQFAVTELISGEAEIQASQINITLTVFHGISIPPVADIRYLSRD
jgi:hypothetical protein